MTTLELGDDAREAASDVVFAWGKVAQKRLDLVDEGVGDVEVAESEGGVANDEVDLIDVGEGGGGACSEERRNDEAGFFEDFGDEAFRVGPDHGGTTEEEFAEPKVELEGRVFFAGYYSLVPVGTGQNKTWLTQEMDPVHLPALNLFVPPFS